MTVTAFSETGSDRFFRQFTSELSVDPIEDIDIADLEAENLVHCFASVQFFKADGVTPSDPTTGTVRIEVGTVNTGGMLEGIPGNVISARRPSTVSWDGNTVRVRALPNDVTGDDVASMRLVLTFNLR